MTDAEGGGTKKTRALGGAKALGGWLAGIAAAVVATIVAAWLMAPEEEKTDPNALPFTVAARQDHAAADGRGWIVTRPFGQIPARPEYGSDWNPWAASAGGIPQGDLMVTFTVQGKSQAQVTLVDLRVRVVNRRAAVAGVLFQEQGAGGGAFRAVFANLDSNPPKLTPYFEDAFIPDDAPAFERKPMTFPYKVSISDAETFVVEGRADKCDCDWVIELSWAAEGKTGTVTIDDDGKPFRVSGDDNVTRVCTTGGGNESREDCVAGPPRS